MKKILLIFMSLLLLIQSGCSKDKEKYEAQFLQLFNTVTQIIGYAESKQKFTLTANEAYALLKEYHELYDIYNNYDGINNLKTINDNAGIKPVKVDRKIIELLLFAREMFFKTDGACNVAMGSVLSIWHDYREAGINDPENAALPDEEELKKASMHCDINNVIIDETASTVYLSDPLMSLDVGAVAKGYAVEQVADAMSREGYQSLIISVGGNVRAIGAKIDGEGNSTPWNVGIRNPNEEDENSKLLYVLISDLSVVTSGVYERYYTVNGVRYHHIIDPTTLMPSDYYASVTIICKDSGIADALSTAIFNMPYEKGRDLIDSLGDTEALWVFADGSMKYSDGFEALLKDK